MFDEASNRMKKKDQMNQLIAENRKTVEAIAMKYIHSPLERDDLIQEGMIGLLAAIKSYDPSKNVSFKTYSATCIENSIQTALRKFYRKKDVPQENVVPYEENFTPDIAGVMSAEETYLAKEAIAEMYQTLEKRLSKLENDVLRLYITGCSYSEIAARLQKGPKAVDNAIQRIRNKLGGISF